MRKTDIQPAAVRGKNPEDREERYKPPLIKESLIKLFEKSSARRHALIKK